MEDKIIIAKGYKLMAQSNIAICAIVRNCEKSLIKNRPKIELLQSKFKNSKLIIFENDSVDETKAILKNWNDSSEDVICKCENFNTITIPDTKGTGVNKYFSAHRISKMVSYRNQYLDMLESLNFLYDFLIIIDLDIENFSLDGIAHSFGVSHQWNVVTANGYSYSPKLKKRYHDTYALVELGNENISQTENSIFENQHKWSFLTAGMPLIPVYSAFGGMAIYKREVVHNLRYNLIPNLDDRVEVKCEHFSLHMQIQNQVNGGRILINPNMSVVYQTINKNIIKNYIKTYFSK